MVVPVRGSPMMNRGSTIASSATRGCVLRQSTMRTPVLASRKVLRPIKIVEIKSKASGEILEMPVEMGDYVLTAGLLTNRRNPADLPEGGYGILMGPQASVAERQQCAEAVRATVSVARSSDRYASQH